MNQGGVKNAAAEPTRLENKRERRRGAAGRAAALRRAPSDSDCSGETASLSADSGDRAPRPQPQPPRSGKTRSRRRGSEWEVLEGLKDGQRFEKRPDVFNGYLHKKRKWPLKGWHKRFFVVDGGILVYARSPTDVARGRLHGSVDVGLSVISAKQRRRRIDIDADEFIYHLRAKTPELFRTWLNVLKVHRLYRQHLLTFGARESAPKIHPPLDELPPTDTSSRTSRTSLASSLIGSSEFQDKPEKLISETKHMLSDFDSSSCYHTTLNSLNWPADDTQESGLLPLTFEPLTTKIGDVKLNEFLFHNHRSLCSMNCVARRMTKIDLHMQRSPDVSLGVTDAERQMISTDLDLYSLRGTDPLRSDKNITSINSSASRSTSNFIEKRKKSVFLDGKVQPTAAYFFFTRKKMQARTDSVESPMRKSKKSTNLVKYRNVMDEPTLKRPLSKCMLLGKYQFKSSRHLETGKAENRAVACDAVQKENNEAQVSIFDKEHKSLQDVMTASDYDKVTERLMASLFDSHKDIPKGDKVKQYINEVVKDLYDDKLVQDKHPVKTLFRSLLEYWLKNTSVAPIQYLMTHTQSVGRQSNKYFTKDVNISKACIGGVNKGTQLHDISDLVLQYKMQKKANANRTLNRTEKKKPPESPSPRRDTESFEKERRIQELEKLLKNTVYICETARSSQSKAEDIKITKTLIDNLERFSRKSDVMNCDDGRNDGSNSSTEKIQETINRLISDTSLPRDIAKEFLSAYLGVLMNDASKSHTNTSSQSSELSIASKKNIVCDVQTESVIKRVSKSITTFKQGANRVKSSEEMKHVDTGQLYLKDVLDKITTIFSKVKKIDDAHWKKEQCNKTDKTGVGKLDTKGELRRSVKEYPMKNLIYENYDENSLVIDLSRYGLENISMYSDPAVQGMMSITIKLKEKSPHIAESARTHLSLKFSDSSRMNSEIKHDKWFSYLHSRETNSKEVFKEIGGHKTFTDFTNEFGLKQFLSKSDATSKAYKVTHESEHSIDLSFKSDSSLQMNSESKKCYENDESCYIMSFKKGSIATKFHSKKKVRLKEYKGIVLSPRLGSPNRSPELSVFEKPAPRVIDEKFILLLLENLTLLSKSLPTLHKDINNLYIKLRKKHEKVLKNCVNVQGLSLLGKIYNEGSQVCPKDATTQCDNESPKSIKETATNTGDITTRVDENVSAMVLRRTHTDTQTEVTGIVNSNQTFSKNNCYIPKIGLPSMPYIPHRFGPVEQTTSNPKWIRNTRECSISTVIKCVLDNERENCIHPIIKPITYDKPLKKLPKLREQSKELTLLNPSIKVSTQSQTDRHMLLFMKDKMMEKDFKVYNLFVSNKYEHVRSSSMTNSTIELEDSDDLKTLYRCTSDPSYSSALQSPPFPFIHNVVWSLGLISPNAPLRGPKAGFVSGTPGGRLASWIIESGGPLENASRELGQAQLSVQQLQRLLDALELQQQVHHDTDVSLEGASPNVKKDRRKFGLRKKKSNSKCASVELQPPHIDPSGSHMALSALTAPPSPGGGSSSAPNSAASLPIACAAARPQSLPGAETLATAQGPASLTSLTPDHQLREDFTVLAKDLVANLKTIVSTLVCERGRLRAAMDAAESASSPSGVVSALRTNLTSALQQNSDLRSRLSKIHDASDLAEISSVGPNSDPQATRPFQQSLSYSSSCVSASEFFDAEEHDEDLKAEIIAADETGVIELDGDSSSEAGSLSSEEGSASSDNSDVLSAEQVTLRLRESESSPVPSNSGQRGWSRRTRLPAPRPTPGGPSLWNLLYKNIGKDLSQISMPVTINEPLNMLQRLCEELEYSELLDAAAACGAAAERMALVAAFAVSAYAGAAHRAASKPFNPLLAETYECVRDDKGFRFLAEQVSHHPPISACHAESARWRFWQEARIKTKFWGKSMEFQPAGRVHVRLTSTGDHYSWNKVTTCVHNLFGGQRWVDQYGDMHITCHGTDISCKLNFIKASSWSSGRHEVRGAVTGGGGRLRLAGRWSEALYAGDPPAARCLWRPGAMPPDHELYYGFTRFAMELNEMEPGMRDALPYTDTRLRPDQRALEEGDVEAAEQFKHQLEQAQRERRRDSPEHTPAWFRKSVECGEETWVFGGEYWAARDAAFPRLRAPRIW